MSCLSVCLSVRIHILGTTHPIFTNFLVYVTQAGLDLAGGTSQVMKLMITG